MKSCNDFGVKLNILVGVTGLGRLKVNRWSWNLLGSFYKVKLDCVPNSTKDFVRRRFVLAILLFAIRAEIAEMAYTRAFPQSTLFLRNEATPNKIFWYTRL